MRADITKVQIATSMRVMWMSLKRSLQRLRNRLRAEGLATYSAGTFKHLRRCEDCLASNIENDVEEALQQ
jgi:hypothetical protein